MKPPSKRVVRDAISALGHMATTGLSFWQTEDDLDLAPPHADRVWHLVNEAREAAGRTGITRDECAAAESLLLQGWTP